MTDNKNALAIASYQPYPQQFSTDLSMFVSKIFYLDETLGPVRLNLAGGVILGSSSAHWSPGFFVA